MSLGFKSSESFWQVKKSGCTSGIPPYQQTQRTVYGQVRYIQQERQRNLCNSGGTVGSNTPHPVWDGGAFLFYSTKIPKSVNKSNLKKQKGKNYD